MERALESVCADWPGGEAEAASFLEESGYCYTNRLDWLRPRPVRRMSAREESAVEYLRREHEWGEVLP